MNEPPIASPVATPTLSAKPKKVAPLLLKVLVGTEIGYEAISLSADAYLTYVAPLLYAREWWTELAGHLIIIVLFFGLLRGNKASWWIIQALGLHLTYQWVSNVAHLYGPSHHHRPVHHTFPSILPAPMGWVLTAVHWSLLIYLFTPPMLRFFFPRPQRAEHPSN